MKESDAQILLDKARAVLRNVWKRRGLAVSAAWVVAIVSAIVIPAMPERYEARARIYVDTQSVLKPMMAGLTYQPDIDRQVRMLARTAISGPNMAKLMERPELGLEVATPAQRNATLSTLLRRTKLTADEPGSLYTISYADTVPDRARRVVEATVELLIDLNAGDKKRDAKDANEFIRDHIRTYEAKLLEAERRLKEFKIKNVGMSGGSKEDYVSRVSTMSGELNKLRSELRAAEEARSVYRAELAREAPQTPVEVELATQKKLLDDMLKRLGDQYPDVVSTRELIARLEAERLGQRQAGIRSAVSTNPAYQRIRASLAETEAQIATLRSRIAVEQQRLDEVQAYSGRATQVEAELAQLTLDHDVIRKNYDQLVARRESASLGVKLDESSRFADFRLVEPPRTSPSPVFPGQVALGILAMVAALAAAVIAPSVADLVRPTFEDSQTLRRLTGRPVIGVVTLVLDAKSVSARRAKSLQFGVAVALLVLFQSGWLVWLQG
jgi:polysaccharide chain length determinant protein (PEP-CTERM system associated)